MPLEMRGLRVGWLETNCYLVWDSRSRDALVVDPGADGEKIAAELRALRLHPKIIVNTHGHMDHIGANPILKQLFSPRILIHAADASRLTDPLVGLRDLTRAAGIPDLPAGAAGSASGPADGFLQAGEKISLGGSFLEVMETPGHTPGSVCLRIGQWLFTGDTLFKDSAGRTDLEGGNREQLTLSLQALSRLPDSLHVFPGHGPESLLGREKSFNPFLQVDQEP